MLNFKLLIPKSLWYCPVSSGMSGFVVLVPPAVNTMAQNSKLIQTFHIQNRHQTLSDNWKPSLYHGTVDRTIKKMLTYHFTGIRLIGFVHFLISGQPYIYVHTYISHSALHGTTPPDFLYGFCPRLPLSNMHSFLFCLRVSVFFEVQANTVPSSVFRTSKC